MRIAESLAKMRLDSFATEADVDEALRLFQVSTLEAFMTGSLEGAEGFTSQQEHDLVVRVEKQLKKRFVIGSQVSEHAIMQDFTRQVRQLRPINCIEFFPITSFYFLSFVGLFRENGCKGIALHDSAGRSAI